MDRRRQVLKRLDKAWVAFNESYAGLSEAQMMEPGVTGAWSVRDTLAHVTSWEEEALKHLPLILKGGTPPRYSVQYGGIDAFNARMTEQKRNLSLSEVRAQLAATHGRLVDFTWPGSKKPRRSCRKSSSSCASHRNFKSSAAAFQKACF